MPPEAWFEEHRKGWTKVCAEDGEEESKLWYPRPVPHILRQVDWRGTGADPGIKDQGMCGSCWSFGATGTMEGVWYVSTGERRSFSEQQLIDCAWDWGPHACGEMGSNYAAVTSKPM